MTGLLVVTFALSGIHTLLWIHTSDGNAQEEKIKRTFNRKEHREHSMNNSEEKYILRFSQLNRMLHIMMIVSFSVLLYRYDAEIFLYKWAVFMAHFYGGFESAGTIHRFAAVIMIIVLLRTLWIYLFANAKEFGTWGALLLGKDSMLPNKKTGATLLIQ